MRERNSLQRHPPVSDISSIGNPLEAWRDSTIGAVNAMVQQENARQEAGKTPAYPASAEDGERLRSRPANPTSISFNVICGALMDLAMRFLRRPDAPRLLAIAVLAALISLAPMAILMLCTLAVLTTLAAYRLLGSDRASKLGWAWYARARQRDPEKAETIRRRAAYLSTCASGLLDRLPSRWTAGLYLPDFEEPRPLPEKMNTDPFDRLAAEKTTMRELIDFRRKK